MAKRGAGVIVTYHGNRDGGPETAEFKSAAVDVLQWWGRTSFDALLGNAGVGRYPVMFLATTACCRSVWKARTSSPRPCCR